MEYEDIEIGKDLIQEAINQIEWDKTRQYYHRQGKQYTYRDVTDIEKSPYWMEKMLQAKALLLQAHDILERIA